MSVSPMIAPGGAAGDTGRRGGVVEAGPVDTPWCRRTHRAASSCWPCRRARPGRRSSLAVGGDHHASRCPTRLVAEGVRWRTPGSGRSHPAVRPVSSEAHRRAVPLGGRAAWWCRPGSSVLPLRYDLVGQLLVVPVPVGLPADRTVPWANEVTVGLNFEPVTSGPPLFGAIVLTANRTRPCWAVPSTRGNSPPMTT